MDCKRLFICLCLTMLGPQSFAQSAEELADTLFEMLDEVVLIEEVSTTRGQLKQVEGTAIFAGKKSEVINLQNLVLNKGANTTRQLFSGITGLTIYENDDAGLQLRNELARRFGQYRCKYVDFGEYKDANEVLVSKGAEDLRNIVKQAKNFPLEGVLNVSDIWDDVLRYNENGIVNYSVELGISDEYYKMAMGEWTVVTGIPNSGKSDIIDQICVNLAMKYDFRVAMFSPESWPYEGHIKRIANKLNEKNCDSAALNKTKDFIEEHFYWVKIDLKNLTLEAILNHFKDLVFQKGVNVCVIDPWNMLDHSAQRDHSYIGKALSQITQFCQQTNTHLYLVAHPRKIESDNGKYKKPTLYDISGSADFFNKSYNGMICFRNIGNRTNYGSDSVEVYVEKVKRKENGQLGSFNIAPDFKNGGVYKGLNTGDLKYDPPTFQPDPVPKIEDKEDNIPF